MGLRNGLRRELYQSPPACMKHPAKKSAGADGRRMCTPPLCTSTGAAATARLAHQQHRWPARPLKLVRTGASVPRVALESHYYLRETKVMTEATRG